MQQMEVGDSVRFRPGSKLPDDWNLPRDAIGVVVRCAADASTAAASLDVDFGADVGFLAGADAGEFELVEPSTTSEG